MDQTVPRVASRRGRGRTTPLGEILHQAEICVDCAGPLKRVQLIRAYGEIKTIMAAPWQLERRRN